MGRVLQRTKEKAGTWCALSEHGTTEGRELQSSLQVMGRAYAAAQNGTLSNDELVQALVSAGEVSQQDLARKDPVGKAAAPHCTARRRVRWAQQDMKLAGLLERDGTNRGRWRPASSAGS